MSRNRSKNDDLDALAARLRGLPEPPVPAGLEARLLAAIPGGGAPAPGPRPPRRWGRLLLGGAAAAAAVLLAFLLANFFGKTGPAPDRPAPPPAPPVAAAELPPTLGNYRLADDTAPAPSSFEWPVQLTASATDRPVPDERTN
jgi:hypothetical protein